MRTRLAARSPHAATAVAVLLLLSSARKGSRAQRRVCSLLSLFVDERILFLLCFAARPLANHRARARRAAS